MSCKTWSAEWPQETKDMLDETGRTKPILIESESKLLGLQLCTAYWHILTCDFSLHHLHRCVASLIESHWKADQWVFLYSSQQVGRQIWAVVQPKSAALFGHGRHGMSFTPGDVSYHTSPIGHWEPDCRWKWWKDCDGLLVCLMFFVAWKLKIKLRYEQDLQRSNSMLQAGNVHVDGSELFETMAFVALKSLSLQIDSKYREKSMLDTITTFHGSWFGMVSKFERKGPVRKPKVGCSSETCRMRGTTLNLQKFQKILICWMPFHCCLLTGLAGEEQEPVRKGPDVRNLEGTGTYHGVDE